MNKLCPFSMALAALALSASCASQAPPSAPPRSTATSTLPAPPAGSQRLPGALACESEVSCSACADDHDRELVRLAFHVHADEVRACRERFPNANAGAKAPLVFRVGIDPSGAAGTSCIVRPSMNDTDLERCVADLFLSWKFPPRKNGAWALVDVPFQVR